MDRMIQDEQQLVAMLGGSTPQVLKSQMILIEFRTFRDVEWRDFHQQVTQWRSDMSERVTKIEVVVETSILIRSDQIGCAYGAGVMPSRRATEVFQSSTLQGHTHSPQSFCRVSTVDQRQKQMGYVSPILGTANAHFMRNRPNSWAHGFTIVDVREDGNFNRYLTIVCDGQFSFGGLALLQHKTV